jgi:esterase/lipase
MGGAISAQLAAEEPSTRALALLAPYLVPPPIVRRLARSSAIWGIFAPYLKSRGEASVRDVSASLDSRAYGTFSPGAIKALVRSASMAMDAIPALTVPAMVVNSKEDNRIPRECADEGIRAFRAAPEVHWVSGCGHVITIDYCKEEVAKLVLRFLDKHTR